MKLKITKDYESMSQVAAQIIVETMKQYPTGLYCFAGGDTPVRTLQLLVEAHQKKEIDLSQAYYIELDEWIGIEQSNTGSCLSYLNRNLFGPANIPLTHIHYFDSQAKDLDKQCQEANAYITLHNGLTLTLLGVGENGHLGFNEPGVSFQNNAHIIDLEETTKTVGKKYFDTQAALTKGITLGIRQLMASKVLIVEANGVKKQRPIEKVLCGKVDKMCPVTVINTHPHAYLIVDQQAVNKERDSYENIN